MVEYGNLMEFQLMIFLLIILGYVLHKGGVIDAEGRKLLVSLVIVVVLPCNILQSFFVELSGEILRSGAAVLVISIAIQMGYVVLNKVLYRRADPRKQMVLKYGTICPNSGFLGNPLVEGLYGAEGLLYASIFLIPQRIVTWTAGIACFTGERGSGAIRRVLTHPCIIATEIGLAVMLLRIPVPGAVERTIAAVGGCTTALVMLIIGGILAEVELRTICSRWTLYYCAVRLLLLPGLTLAGCYLLGVGPLVSAVATVLTGMPAGTTTAILAERYGGDAHFGVKCVCLSTALSLGTIPLLCLIVEWAF